MVPGRQGGGRLRQPQPPSPEPLSWLFGFVSHTLQLSPYGITVTTVDSPLADALRDRYLLERELGRGGMATVYLARDLRHDRPVALKVLHPELAHALGPERFVREIKLAARLQHPHILPVFDSGSAQQPDSAVESLWFTMPYVAGESLRPSSRRSALACSGLMYKGVPNVMPVPVSRSPPAASSAWATPKSASTQCSPESRMFSGLTSRWTMPCRWA